MTGQQLEAASRNRRIVAAVVASDIGAVAIAIGGILALSSGLVVVAAVTGIVIGWLMRSPSADGATGRAGSNVILAIAIALLGVATGQLLLWVVALAEGGVLGPLDYLAQTFGFLVPAQFIVGAVGAWLAAR
jgi:hypothetical protein